MEQQLILDMIEYIEDKEERIEDEWGSGKSLQTLINEGGMPDLWVTLQLLLIS